MSEINKRFHINESDILESFEYKVLRRALKQKYNWIMDVVPNNNINDYMSIFFVIKINPFILQKEQGWILRETTIYDMQNKKHPRAYSYLDFPFDIDSDVSDDFEMEIRDMMDLIRNTSHIPEEHKLPFKKDRGFDIGGYVIPTAKEIPIPKDVIVSK